MCIGVVSGGPNFGVCLRLKNLQEGWYKDFGQEPVVHPNTCVGYGHGGCRSSYKDEVGLCSKRFTRWPEGEGKPSGHEEIHQWPKTLKELFYRYPCCPPDALYHIRQFYKNKYLKHWQKLQGDPSGFAKLASRNPRMVHIRFS